MSEKDSENVGMEVKLPVNSRRKFLVKATAGAVVATLPAKAVWATGTAGSITASGHSSDFAQNHPIKIKGSHFWLANAHTYDIEQEYAALAGGTWPMVHHKVQVLLKHQMHKVRLCHLMGATQAVEGLIKHIYASDIGSGNSPFFTNNGKLYLRWNYSGSVMEESLYWVGTKLKGWSKRNEVIANVFLSAVNSSIHPTATIYYPVLKSKGGYGTITSETILMQKLHHAADNSRVAFVNEFKSMTV